MTLKPLFPRASPRDPRVRAGARLEPRKFQIVGLAVHSERDYVAVLFTKRALLVDWIVDSRGSQTTAQQRSFFIEARQFFVVIA